MTTHDNQSPRWSQATKAIIAIFILAILGIVVANFPTIIQSLMLASILTFILVPMVRLLNRKARLPWALAANIAFILLLAILIGASTAAGAVVVDQLTSLFDYIQDDLSALPDLVAEISQQSIIVGPWTLELPDLDLAAVVEQIIGIVQPLLGEASTLLATVATGAIESLFNIIFVLAGAYFLTLDYRQIRQAVKDISIAGFTDDFHKLRTGLSQIWIAFLRGQLLVVLSTGILTGLLMRVLDVRYAIGLGVLGGLAKFIPIVGPLSAGGVAATVALFQADNWFNITPFGHAILVIACVFVLDQAIDYLLIPRIMGTTLNLHPVVVLVGLLIGASLAGVIGLLLASPGMASLIFLARYIYRKMFDLPPWDPPLVPIRVEVQARPKYLQKLRDRIRRPKSVAEPEDTLDHDIP
ncbi:MAG: AI-2E family transporter [Anaerolineales bacterium]|jgi:predicted PurR-regulated permease PerM